MFAVDWISKALPISRAKPKILVLGLDNSGKTTLLIILNRTSPLLATSLGPLVTIPTLSPSSTEFLIGDTVCDGYDIGGYLPNRTCWAQYTYDVSGVIFCVDASDPDKFDTAKFELDKLLVNENLDGVPILVFGTKVDAPKSVNEERLMQALNIGYTLKKGTAVAITNVSRPIEVFMCSMLSKRGIESGMLWLSQFINK